MPSKKHILNELKNLKEKLNQLESAINKHYETNLKSLDEIQTSWNNCEFNNYETMLDVIKDELIKWYYSNLDGITAKDFIKRFLELGDKSTWGRNDTQI